MTVKCSKWPKNIPAFSILRPSKIYPNWDFWFENKPSGNPAVETTVEETLSGLPSASSAYLRKRKKTTDAIWCNVKFF
jgi:hypothetical protein